MSTKKFIIILISVALIGIIATVSLYFYTAKLQKEASIISFISNEEW